MIFLSFRTGTGLTYWRTYLEQKLTAACWSMTSGASPRLSKLPGWEVSILSLFTGSAKTWVELNLPWRKLLKSSNQLLIRCVYCILYPHGHESLFHKKKIDFNDECLTGPKFNLSHDKKWQKPSSIYAARLFPLIGNIQSSTRGGLRFSQKIWKKRSMTCKTCLQQDTLFTKIDLWYQ